uniref:Uncharacterized protein n=1 Tax=Rhizophora mucronata TaxID=61149 RepID=A0A2P2QRF7_RHIMU
MTFKFNPIWKILVFQEMLQNELPGTKASCLLIKYGINWE